MKTILVAVLLALAVANGLALRCRHCNPRPGGSCTETIETCRAGMNTCVAGKDLVSPYRKFQMCMTAFDCRSIQLNPTEREVNCCQTDLCNTPIM